MNTRMLMLVCLLLGFGCREIGRELSQSQTEVLEQELIEMKWLTAFQIALMASPPGGADIFDNGNGTVSVRSQALLWAKCNQLNSSGTNAYASTANDCSSSGGLFTYCSAMDNSCNNLTDPRILNGSGTSGAYSTCNALFQTFPGRAWRVPTATELLAFHQQVYQKFPALFPAYGSNYWSSTASAANTTQAWNLDNATASSAPVGKTATYSVRCVAAL